MHAQKTQNTAAFEVPLYAVVGRRYEYALKSMLKRQCLVTIKGTTSEFDERVGSSISRTNWEQRKCAPAVI